MIKILAVLKFVASVILLIGILMGLFFSLDKSTEVSVILISSFLLLSLVGVYSYYLIRTDVKKMK